MSFFFLYQGEDQYVYESPLPPIKGRFGFIVRRLARATVFPYVVVFTLAACTDLTRPGELSGEPIAQGMGQALIRLDPLNARTAIPSLESLHFTLDFTASETPERKVSKTLEEGLTLTVALESGDWDLVVEGFSKEDRLMV